MTTTAPITGARTPGHTPTKSIGTGSLLSTLPGRIRMVPGGIRRDPWRSMIIPTQIITGQALTVTIGATVALATTSLADPAGEVVAVIGPSGSGKFRIAGCWSVMRGPS